LQRVELRSFELLFAAALLTAACAGSEAASGRGEPAPLGDSERASCPPAPVTLAHARSLVDTYCVSCHSPTGEAGEDYDFREDRALTAHRRTIEAKLRLRLMPPPAARQPSDAERARLACWAKG